MTRVQGASSGIKPAGDSKFVYDTSPHLNQPLVGGWATPLKNMKVSWDDYSQYMQK